MAGGEAEATIVTKVVKDLLGDAAEGAARDGADDLAKHGAEALAKDGAEDLGKKATDDLGRDVTDAGRRETGDPLKDGKSGTPPGDRTGTKDPIDVATGEVLLAQTDLTLPGVLPLVLERTHVSSYRQGGLFGVSWASTLDQRLEVDGEGVWYAAPDGTIAAYPPTLMAGVSMVPTTGPLRPLTFTGDGYTLHDPKAGRTLHLPPPGGGHGWSPPPAAVTDRNGNRIEFVRDDSGTLREVRHSGGYRVGVETDDGRVTALRLLNAADRPVLKRFGYDGAGRLTEVYNGSADHPTRFEPDGTRWRHTYDERGNLLTVTDPLGFNTRFTCDERGGVREVIDALGGRVRVENDDAGLPGIVTDQVGAVTTYAHGPFGRLVSITDPVGGVTRFAWTTAGEPSWRRHPSGAVERWAYDGEGNLTQYADASGNVTRFETGCFDQRIAEVGADGSRTEFGYDSELRLISVTNPLGLTWQYDYDAVGNLVHEADFNGHELSCSYDGAGMLAARVNGAGEVTHYTRDVLGNVVEQRAGDMIATFAYDPAGRLVRALNSDADLQLRRDRLGRVVAENCNGRAMTVDYDALGRRVRRRTPAGAESIWRLDPAGRPTALHTVGQTITFARDVMGRESRRRIGVGAILEQQWNADHQLASQTLWGAPTAHAGPTGQARLLQHRAYTYRADGNVIGVADHTYGDRRFDLDPGGRITGVRAPGWFERYAYDPAGNVTDMAFAAARHDPAMTDALGRREYVGTQVRVLGGVRHEYDAQGRLVLRQRKRLSAKPDTWRYTWDADDRLTDVITPDRQRWRYLYDAIGRRIAKQRLAPDGVGVVEQTDFAWDNVVLAEEARGLRADGGEVLHVTTWEYEPEEFRPLSQAEWSRTRTLSQERTDQRFFAIVTDLIGQPTELVDPEATSRGGRGARYGVPQRAGKSAQRPARCDSRASTSTPRLASITTIYAITIPLPRVSCCRTRWAWSRRRTMRPTSAIPSYGSIRSGLPHTGSSLASRHRMNCTCPLTK